MGSSIAGVRFKVGDRSIGDCKGAHRLLRRLITHNTAEATIKALKRNLNVVVMTLGHELKAAAGSVMRCALRRLSAVFGRHLVRRVAFDSSRRVMCRPITPRETRAPGR